MLIVLPLLLFVLWLACPVIGALIAPRKGVEPPTAFVACVLWGYIGIVYLALMPDLPEY